MAKSVRRSSRARVHQDYAAMEGVGLDLSDEEELGRKEKRFKGRKVRHLEVEAMYSEVMTREDFDETEPAVMAPEEVTADWLRSEGLKHPVLVRAAPNAVKKMGMKIPSAESLSPLKVAAKMGPSHTVPTMDVNSQSEGPRMTMREWAEYWGTPRGKRRQLLNVLSLSLAGTPLEPAVRAPAAVEAVDLVAAAWPADVHPRPMVKLYMLMSVEGCYTDFHLDFGGSSVWYHMVSGRKVFLLAPPTPSNLAAFVDWASSKKQSAFFGDMATGLHRLEINAGDTLLLPGGWPHAVATPEASIALGGNFLYGGNLPLQLEVHRIEDRLGVAKKFRFPLYKQLMWRTAQRYTSLLQAQLPHAQEHPLKCNSSSEGSSEMPGGKAAASASTGFTGSRLKKAKADVPSSVLAGAKQAQHTASKPIPIPTSHAGRAGGAVQDTSRAKFRLKIRKPAPGSAAAAPQTIPTGSTGAPALGTAAGGALLGGNTIHEAPRTDFKEGAKKKGAAVTEEQEVEQPMPPMHRPPGRRSSHEYYPEMSTGSANNSMGSPHHNPAYHGSGPLGSSPATAGGGSQIIEFLGPWKHRPAGSTVTASSGRRPALASAGGGSGAGTAATLATGAKPFAFPPTHSTSLPPSKKEGGSNTTQCRAEVLSPRVSSPVPTAGVKSHLQVGPNEGAPAPAPYTSTPPAPCVRAASIHAQLTSETLPPSTSAQGVSRSPGHGFDPSATAASKRTSPVGQASGAAGDTGDEKQLAGDPEEDRWRCKLSVLRSVIGEEWVEVADAKREKQGECTGAPGLQEEECQAGLESDREARSDGRKREVRSDERKLPDDPTAAQPAGSGTSARSGHHLAARENQQGFQDVEERVESKVKLKGGSMVQETRSVGEEGDTNTPQRGAVATAGPVASSPPYRVSTETAPISKVDVSPNVPGHLGATAAPSAPLLGGSVVPEERKTTAVNHPERTSEEEEHEHFEGDQEEPYLSGHLDSASPATSFAMPPPRPPRMRKEDARAHAAEEADHPSRGSRPPRRGGSANEHGGEERREEQDGDDVGAEPGLGQASCARLPGTPVVPTRPTAGEGEEVCSPPEKPGAAQGQPKEDAGERQQVGGRDEVGRQTPAAIPSETAETGEEKWEREGAGRDLNFGARAEAGNDMSVEGGGDAMDLEIEPKKEAAPGAECAGKEGSVDVAAPAMVQSPGAAATAAASAAVGGKEGGKEARGGGGQAGAGDSFTGGLAPKVKLRISLRNTQGTPFSPSSPVDKTPGVRRRVVLKVGGSSAQAGACATTPRDAGHRKLRITGAFASNQEVATPRTTEGWGEAAAAPASSALSDPGSESDGDLSQGAGSTGYIKPHGASLSPTEPESSKPSLCPRIVLKPLSGAARQAPSIALNQENTAGAMTVAKAKTPTPTGAEPEVELLGGVISRPESEGLPWLHSELQAWLDASEGVRTAAGVPSDIVSPDNLLQQFHKCIQELGITSDVVFLPDPKERGFKEEEDYNPKQKIQPNRKNGTPRGNKTAVQSKGKSSYPPIAAIKETLSNKRPAPVKKGNVMDRLAKKLRRK